LRPIKNNIWASFYTITLDWANYTYSKHYYVPNGSYWVLTLETGTGIDKENIAEKNVEFKNKNGDFDTSATDEYFRNLIDM
jgi:formate-dependent nitrite reductase cytochrome c552 subunit